MTPLFSWAPILAALMSVAIMVSVGLAVVGQVRWRATQEWEALATAREERIHLLENALKELAERTERDIKLQQATITALEGQVAELQRINFDLQRELRVTGKRKRQ